MTQIIKSSIAAAHRPHIGDDLGLIVTGHAAVEHAHVPCVAGVVCIRSTRPVPPVLHILKRMPTGQGRTVIPKITQAMKLPDIWQAPVAYAGAVRESTISICQIVAISH